MSSPISPLPVDATLQTGWKLFTRSFLACLPLGLLGVCAGGAPQAFALATRHSQDLQWWLVYAASSAIMLICYGAVILFQHALLTGGQAALARSLRLSLARLPATVLSSVLALAAVLAGLVLLIVPGLVLATYLMFAWPVLLVESRGPIAALSRSVQLVSGNFWRLASLFGIAAAGVLVFVILAGVFAGVIMLVAQAGGASALAQAAPELHTGAVATIVLSLLLVCPVLYLCSLGIAAYVRLSADR